VPVDLLTFVLYKQIRAISGSGVMGRMHSFSNSKESPGLSGGYSSGGGLPGVVELDRSIKEEMLTFLEEGRGLSSFDAKRTFDSTSVWHGVVDGAHRLLAITPLADENPENFAGYPWYVLTVICARMELLKAFARDRNEKMR